MYSFLQIKYFLHFDVNVRSFSISRLQMLTAAVRIKSCRIYTFLYKNKNVWYFLFI